MACSTRLVWRNASALAWLTLAACSSGQEVAAGSPRAAAGSAAVPTTQNAVAGAGGSGGGGSDAGGRGGAGSGSKASGLAATGGVGGSRSAAMSPGGRGGAEAPAAGGTSGVAGAAGASAAKGKLYSDDFEDGDLTKPSWIDADPEQGAKWMVVAADGGKVLAQTASVSDWVFAAAGDYRWTDQVVEARVKITSEPGKAGIFARVRDTRNYYFLYIDGGSSLVLRKRVDNSSGDVQKTKVETKADTWYTLKLSVIGNMLEGSLDGKVLVSGSDSGVTAGGIGVGTSDCTAQFDDIIVNGS